MSSGNVGQQINFPGAKYLKDPKKKKKKESLKKYLKRKLKELTEDE